MRNVLHRLAAPPGRDRAGELATWVLVFAVLVAVAIHASAITGTWRLGHRASPEAVC